MIVYKSYRIRVCKVSTLHCHKLARWQSLLDKNASGLTVQGFGVIAKRWRMVW